METEHSTKIDVGDKMRHQQNTRDIKPGVLHNARGVRSGWRLLIWLIITGAGALAFSFLLSMVPALRNFNPRTNSMALYLNFVAMAVLFAIAFAAALVPAVAIEKRPISSLGLPFHHRTLPELCAGFVIGVVLIGITMTLLRICGAYSFAGFNEGLPAAVKWGTIMGLGFLCVGLFEEFCFRGYLLQNLSDAAGLKFAVFITSLLFSMAHMHNPGENPAGIIDVFAAAILLTVCILKTRSLWLAVGLHASWDWGQSFLFGVADSGTKVPGYLLNSLPHGPAWLSGGTAGPEGSIVAVIIHLLAAFIIYKYAPIHAEANTEAQWKRYIHPGWRKQAQG